MKQEYYILQNKDGDFCRAEGIGEASYYWATNEWSLANIFYDKAKAQEVADKHELTVLTLVGKPFVNVSFEPSPIAGYLKAPMPETSRWMKEFPTPCIPR